MLQSNKIIDRFSTMPELDRCLRSDPEDIDISRVLSDILSRILIGRSDISELPGEIRDEKKMGLGRSDREDFFLILIGLSIARTRDEDSSESSHDFFIHRMMFIEISIDDLRFSPVPISLIEICEEELELSM